MLPASLSLDALHCPSLAVFPPAPPGPPLTLAWLRAGVARFTDGPDHGPRRGYVRAVLDQVDLARVRATAHRLATTALAPWRGRQVDLMAVVARPVPVLALAEELGWPTVEVDHVAAVAAHYLTGAAEPETVEADAAVARLVGAVGGGPDEVGAARVSALVQAYAATAALVGNACALLLFSSTAEPVPGDVVVAATLRDAPPVIATRRVATVDCPIGSVHIGAGEAVLVALGGAGLPFGAGPHACPGEAQARAIAAGVLDAVRGCRPVGPEVTFEPHPTVRAPARLPVHVP
jgi:cytochrome P450